MMVNASMSTTAPPPPPPATGPVAIEESRAQRLQRQQARFRDRGGIFVPTNRNTLADILLGRKPRQSRSPRKSGKNVMLPANVNDVNREETSNNKRDTNNDTVPITTGEKLKHTRKSPEKPVTRIRTNTTKTANGGTKRRGRPPKITKDDDIPKGQCEEGPLTKKSSKVDSLPKTKSKVSRQRTSKKKSGVAATTADSSCLEPDESHESRVHRKGKTKDSGAEVSAKPQVNTKANAGSTSEVDSNPTSKKTSRKEYSNKAPKQPDATEVPQVKSKQKRIKARDKGEELEGSTKSNKKTSDSKSGKPTSCPATSPASSKRDQESTDSSNKSCSVPEKKSSSKRSRKVTEAEEDEEKPITSKPMKRTKVEAPISVEGSLAGKKSSKSSVHKAGTKVVLKGKKTKTVTGILPMPSMVLEILRRPPTMDEDDEPDPIDFLS